LGCWGLDLIVKTAFLAEYEPMDEQGSSNIQELRERLARGEYRVEPVAVADAVIRRAAGLDLAGDYARLVDSVPSAPVRRRRRGRSPVSESLFTARAVAAL
jgi:hypothetical protein